RPVADVVEVQLVEVEFLLAHGEPSWPPAAGGVGDGCDGAGVRRLPSGVVGAVVSGAVPASGAAAGVLPSPGANGARSAAAGSAAAGSAAAGSATEPSGLSWVPSVCAGSFTLTTNT